MKDNMSAHSIVMAFIECINRGDIEKVNSFKLGYYTEEIGMWGA